MRALLLQPYDAGSHHAWAEGLVGNSSLDWTVLRLPGRFWKWRMHGAAVSFARMLPLSGRTPDVVLTTDMLDLAAFRGLAGRRLDVPVALYMHENQLEYPDAPLDDDWTPSRRRRAARPEVRYGWLNATAALAADRVFWNSAHNRDSFLAALPRFVRQFPDERPEGLVDAIAAKSEILPLGLALPPPPARPNDAIDRPPRLVWNHRWEHDKDPDAFVALVAALVAEGTRFEAVLLGETFGRVHPARARALETLGDRVVHDGFAPDAGAYFAQLAASDVVVSTARHEFFGASVCEAVWAGAWPILPRGLAYEGWMPDAAAPRVLYAGADDRLALTRAALAAAASPRARLARRAAQDALRSAIAPFAWPAMAPRYDAALEAVVRRAGGGRPLVSAGDGPPIRAAGESNTAPRSDPAAHTNGRR
ncbi:MAG: DUF3524 domain-containing protein [Anaerolineae bacterium]